MEEDEVDLHKYVELLLRHWKLILGFPILAALAAFAISTFIPSSYEATVFITVAAPQTLTTPNATDLQGVVKSYISMATSDQVLNQLLADPALTTSTLNPKSLEGLRKIATASASSADPSMIVLKVQFSDAVQAAAMANAWASALTDELFRQGKSDLATFQAQVLEADQRLRQAGADLAVYQASNSADIVAVRLSVQKAVLADLLSRRYLYMLLVKDAQDQRVRLAKLEANTPAGGIDNIAILTLLQRLSSASAVLSLAPIEPAQPTASQFDQSGGVQPNSPAASFQVQITDSTLSGKTAGEQIVYLDTFISSLQVRVTETDGLATALEPEILTLQGKLSSAAASEAQLVQKQNLAQEAYQTVVHKMDDARLAATDVSNNVHINRRAVIPTTPVSPGRLNITVLAGVIAFMLMATGVLGRDWWEQKAIEAKR